MKADARRDLSASARDFVRFVVPVLLPAIGGGAIESAEAVSEQSFATKLDMAAGIDAYHIHSRGMRGIGQRVQWVDRSWDTYTIRYKRSNGSGTEYAKRIKAIKEAEYGWMFPHLTVHAYIKGTQYSPSHLISLAYIRTTVLFSFVSSYLGANEPTRDSRKPVYLQRVYEKDGTWQDFIVVKWSALGDAGYVVRL